MTHISDVDTVYMKEYIKKRKKKEKEILTLIAIHSAYLRAS